MCASFQSTLPASGPPETDAHMQVVVVSGEDLDDSWRPAKTRVRTDEDSLRSRSNEEVDERLRQPKIDLADTQRGPLSTVEQWVVHVDVEAVLM
jgi:hypothetical protein